MLKYFLTSRLISYSQDRACLVSPERLVFICCCAKCTSCFDAASIVSDNFSVDNERSSLSSRQSRVSVFVASHV